MVTMASLIFTDQNIARKNAMFSLIQQGWTLNNHYWELQSFPIRQLIEQYSYMPVEGAIVRFATPALG